MLQQERSISSYLTAEILPKVTFLSLIEGFSLLNLAVLFVNTNTPSKVRYRFLS
jgi:hypothetical protein